MEKIVTRTQEMVLDEYGIVCCRVLEGAQIDLEDAQENVRAVRVLSRNKPVPVFVDISGSKGGTKEARNYFASEEVAEIQTACAFLVNSPFAHLIGNFFLGLNRTKFPFQLFRTEEKAKRMAAKISMTQSVAQKIDLNDLIAMIGSIAALDFSKRLEVELDEDPATVIAYGLNMLSEELEDNVVKRSTLEEVNKNLEQFAYILAHDIKSPLSIALGLLSIIEPELDLEKSAVLKEYYPPLKKSLLRINSMIINILEYSRTSFDQVKISELNLQKICEEIRQLYPAEGRPEIQVSAPIPVISFNEIAMRQILQNLIDNAVKYNDKPVCRVELTCNNLPGFYEISVRDNGPGIADKNLALVFELFENLHSKSSQSHGVGLAIVRKLIEQAGGTIRVASVLQSGTTFSFTISKDFIPGNSPA